MVSGPSHEMFYQKAFVPDKMQTRGRISDGLLENLLFRELFILWMSGDKIF